MSGEITSSLVSDYTILTVLTNHANQNPTKKIWSYLNDACNVYDSYTYMELEMASSLLATQLLTTHKLHSGDRALLVFFPGLSFTVSLLACFKAGIIAVPVFPPDPRKLQKDLDHFVSIQKSADAQYVLTHHEYDYSKKLSELNTLFSMKRHEKWPQLKWIIVDDILNKGKQQAQQYSNKSSTTTTTNSINLKAIQLSDIAFLQYTSGSTSEPKGVMITHNNLLHNLQLIIKELKATSNTINISWLPQYHDMGLIGSYLGTLFCNGIGYYLSPISFLKNPNIWLQAISKYQGTHTQAPNFAYALAVRKYREYIHDLKYSHPTSTSSTTTTNTTTTTSNNKDDHHSNNNNPMQLNLSSIQHMINAAEPVDSDAIRDFYTLFQPYGLSPNVIIPTYGLAEHTVFVCSGGQNLLYIHKDDLERGNVHVIKEEKLYRSISSSTDMNNIQNHISVTEENNQDIHDGKQRIQRLVGCGFYKNGDRVSVKIVNAETCIEVKDGMVGEIWINSPSKALGYWNQSELTQDSFYVQLILPKSTETNTNDDEYKVNDNTTITSTTTSATTSINININNSNSDQYLRTGDIGFLYHDELFICGRIKDMIIIRGMNHYPQDIERTAERYVNEIRAGCTAAFDIPHLQGHTETVVFLAELKANIPTAEYPIIVQNIRSHISEEHGISLSSICLLHTKSIIKTTSGKISRQGCKKAYINQQLNIVYKWEGGQEGNNGNNNNGIDYHHHLLAIRDSENCTDESHHHPTKVSTTTATSSSSSHALKSGPTSGSGPEGQKQKRYTADEIRALSMDEIIGLLEKALIQVSSQGPSPLHPPIVSNVSMISLGLDSFTLIQYKGMIEKRFHCQLPDEFLFTNIATLTEIAKTVKHGSLTPVQHTQFYSSSATTSNDGGGPQSSVNTVNNEIYDATGNKTTATTTTANKPSSSSSSSSSSTNGGVKSSGSKGKRTPHSAVVVEQKTPCCPWFTCCY